MLAERANLFETFAKVADGGGQAEVEGFRIVLNRNDAQRRFSITYDQGHEVSQHRLLHFRLENIKILFKNTIH